MLPNPPMTNAVDLITIDPLKSAVFSGNSENFGGMNVLISEVSMQISMASQGSADSVANSRGVPGHLMANSSLPLGAQIFTIPVSLATFPNSDLIPVFVNSLGQMVLANPLTSLQQLASASHDTAIFSNGQHVTQSSGILEYLFQQYQQVHMMQNSVRDTFQEAQIGHCPQLTAQPVLPSPQGLIRLDPSDKSNPSSTYPMPTSCSSSSLPSDKLVSTSAPSADCLACGNKSPSVTSSSSSSRSVGNKINQMIDVSKDYILGQDDHVVREKAAELIGRSYSRKSQNKASGGPSKSMGSIALSEMVTADEFSEDNHGLTVDGVDIGEIRAFARDFKIKRLSVGLTQTQVGQALTAAEGPAYSQSAICRFEKLDITPKSAQKIKPILEKWIKEFEEKYLGSDKRVDEDSGSDGNKKRKRRTSFTPQALELLKQHFDKKSHPAGSEMRALASELHYDREVIRVWFCNKRQAQKNSQKTVQPSKTNGSPDKTATGVGVNGDMDVCFVKSEAERSGRELKEDGHG